MPITAKEVNENSGSSEAKDGGGLVGCAQDEEKHKAKRNDLDAKGDDGAERLEASP